MKPVASRWLSRVIVALLATGALSVSAAASPPSEIAVLDRVTTFSTNRSGVALVELEQPITLQLAGNGNGIPGFEAEGESDVAGLLIRSADAAAGQGPEYLLMRTPTNFEANDEITIGSVPDVGICSACPMPAGRYLIYVLATGSLDITLRIPDLPPSEDEEQEPIPLSPVDADIKTPTATDVRLPGSTARVWSAGSTGQLTGAGAHILLTTLEGPTNTHSSVAFGTCSYDAEGPPLGIVTPACLGGSHRFGGLLNRSETDYSVTRLEYFRPMPQGESGLGAYADVVGASEDFAVTAIWLPFDQP